MNMRRVLGLLVLITIMGKYNRQINIMKIVAQVENYTLGVDR